MDIYCYSTSHASPRLPIHHLVMSQQTLLTVSEGGIPAQVETILDLVGAADQSQSSTTTTRDARISTVPLEESLAIPLTDDTPVVENPAEWPEDVRGMPHYRPVNRHLDYSVRPMGANGVEWTFLQFMFTGVRVVGVRTTCLMWGRGFALMMGFFAAC